MKRFKDETKHSKANTCFGTFYRNAFIGTFNKIWSCNLEFSCL